LTLVVFKDHKKLELENSIKIETKIGFMEKDCGFGGILGVYGFLDRFIFTGDISNCYFELTPVFE
jgi:hypothetical protein